MYGFEKSVVAVVRKIPVLRPLEPSNGLWQLQFFVASEAACASCISVLRIYKRALGLKHAHKASGVLISELIVYSRWGVSRWK